MYIRPELVIPASDATQRVIDLFFFHQARDPGTALHQLRVAEYAVSIGQKMGLTQWEIDLGRNSALVHDIGKLGISGDILRKTGDLTLEERKAMEAHVVLGTDILTASGLDEEASIVIAHHERWDGQGYPHGLVGTDISRIARIVAVADNVAALEETRVYKDAWTPDKIEAMLQEESGKFFDPEVVDAYLSMSLETNLP